MDSSISQEHSSHRSMMYITSDLALGLIECALWSEWVALRKAYYACSQKDHIFVKSSPTETRSSEARYSMATSSCLFIARL